MEACWSGDASEVSRLIAAGADVNAQNANGTTPLMYAKTYAFRTGETEIMTTLIEHGADPLVRDNDGKTAADYTTERSRLILEILEAPGNS
nr:ankyrin repeat domain-containing protein [uncultured Hoeflea sp.]